MARFGTWRVQPRLWREFDRTSSACGNRGSGLDVGGLCAFQRISCWSTSRDRRLLSIKRTPTSGGQVLQHLRRKGGTNRTSLRGLDILFEQGLSPSMVSPIKVHRRCLLSTTSKGNNHGVEPPPSKEEKRKEIWSKIHKVIRSNFLFQLREVNAVENFKLFTASDSLEPASLCKPLPTISAQSLAGTTLLVPRKDTATLLLLGFNQMGFESLNSWREPVERHLVELRSHGGRGAKATRLQIVEIIVTESKALKMMSGLLLNAFRSTVDARRYPWVASVYQDFDLWKDALGIKNTLVGYAFLIDPKGLIRWRGCAEATFDESIQLIDCISSLLAEGVQVLPKKVKRK